MIRHSSAGVKLRGHPPGAVNNGTGRVDVSQIAGQLDVHSERLPTPQPQSGPPAAVDLAASVSHGQLNPPPAKRPRLDVPSALFTEDAIPVSVGSGDLKNTPGSTDSRLPFAPLRSRPAWSFKEFVSDIPTAETPAENTMALGRNGASDPPPPLPGFPWKYTPAESLGNSSARSREGSPSNDVQTTPYRIQVPDVAPVLKGNKMGDFFPWTGNHPEDVLNEQTAKQGHYDRTRVSQNESNTARPSLYAQLKNRPGLQILSSVFAAALEKRQNYNVVNTPSTFKPPPRVTLTDNKRETWLRDLANPSVPLRRLSRTIPHGIRGKALLDQCLSKWIPVGRAVWLAKCVGANEIRAFKRKGTSGTLAVGLEVKWVRDWTSNVQQFLEGILSSCGTADWKVKIRYATSLTARLFFEQLLDHDHYLEWFLTSLEAAPIRTVPIWLLMLGIYWDNIMRYRKRGRRLAEILLEKLSLATNSEQAEPLQQLIARLSCCVKKLAREHTSSVVLPNSWDKYKDLVQSCLNFKDNIDKAIFQSLVERNSRVQRPKNCHPAIQCTTRQRIIRLLDSKGLTLDIQSLSTACLNSAEDKTVLVLSVLEWSATPFRSGLYRVYTTVRLLRKWKMCGIDVDSCILSFLAESRHCALNKGNIYHVISELVRSQTFSVGRYLQWIMARGLGESFQSGHQKDTSADIGLLTQLPTNRLPEHVCNLRDILLTRAGLSVSEEISTIETVKASISRRLPKIFEHHGGDVLRDLPQSNLTWTVKAELSQWVRRGIARYYLGSARAITGDASNDPGISALTPEEFYHVRDILESFEDLSMLADVLRHATNCDDGIVLASVADTINCHLHSFFIIGATTDLFRKLLGAYTRLKRLGTANLDLLFSLIELGFQIPNEFNTVILLRQDFSRLENKSVMTVPSPVSDHIPEISSETDPSLYAKMEQILSSGGGIDEHTWDTAFNVLTRVLESAPDQTKLAENDTARYLAQLRRFYPKRFDGMLIRWVCGVLKSSPRSTLLKALPSLIGVGCVSIQAFIALVEKLSRCDNGKMTPNIDMLKVDLIALLAAQNPEQGRYFDLVSYRFQLAQQEFLAKHSEETLAIIRDATVSVNRQDQKSDSKSKQHDLTGSMMKLLRVLLTQNPESSAKLCIQKLTGQQPAFIAALQKTLDCLLDFDLHCGNNPNVTEAEKVINMVDDFSLPFCQLKLQILFAVESRTDVTNDIVDVMFKAAVADSGAKRSHWADLVALMSEDAVRQIRERAENEFFSIPLLDNPHEDPSSGSKPLESARVYLSIVDQLAGSIPDAGVQSVAPILVEKMDLLLHRVVVTQTNLNSLTENRQGKISEQTTRFCANFERAVAFWFSALLRMVVLHRSAFRMPAMGAKLSNLPEQTRLLISIFCISLSRHSGHILPFLPAADYFPRPIPSTDGPSCLGILMQTHALDVAASMIDTVPDEARHQCAHFLKEKCPLFAKFQNDPRFAYLLGPITDPQPSFFPQPPSLPSPAASGSIPAPTPGNATNASQPIATSEGPNSDSGNLRIQYRGRIVGPCPLRPWELLEDAAPIVGTNDTAISLSYFDARRVRA